jgi:hypothetical protein
MNKEFQLYVFEFEGTSETVPQQLPTADYPTDLPEDSEVIFTLNEQASKIAEDLEREIMRFFRSSATVQAEIRFYEGSIIIQGTILIMSWLGPIAIAAGKKAFEEEFARVVQVATQRVLQRALQKFAPTAEPLQKIDVSAQAAPSAPQITALDTGTELSPTIQPNPFRILPTLMMINVGLMVIVLFLQILSALRLTP